MSKKRKRYNKTQRQVLDALAARCESAEKAIAKGCKERHAAARIGYDAIRRITRKWERLDALDIPDFPPFVDAARCWGRGCRGLD